MKDYLNLKIFRIISKVITENDLQGYVIGGYVRDKLLKRASKDIDVVIIGSGIEIAKKVAAEAGNVKVNVFKNFGTAMLRYDNYEIEFVGARKESYRRNSRKPIVENGTLEDDQKRRDFTVNSLAISLNKGTWGKLIDPFEGIKDLKKKIIRTPLDPDTTYSDDPLRMLRAIRFATQLDFTIDESSLHSVSKNCERIKIISAERIVDELNKIFLAGCPSKGILLLNKTGLLDIILPEVSAMKGIEMINNIGHKDNFYHTVKVLDNVAKRSDDLWLRWSALLHDIGKPVTKRFDRELGWTFHAHDYKGAKMVVSLFKRLKMPLGNEMKYVQKMVRLHLRPISLVEDTVTDSAVRRLLFDAGDDIDDLMLLAEADITSKNDIKVARYLRNFKKVRKKLKEIEEKDRIRNFQPPIHGELIMKTFNIPPCKNVGLIKDAIKDAILDGVIRNDYEEAYGYMMKVANELGIVKNKERQTGDEKS